VRESFGEDKAERGRGTSPARGDVWEFPHPGKHPCAKIIRIDEDRLTDFSARPERTPMTHAAMKTIGRAVLIVSVVVVGACSQPKREVSASTLRLEDVPPALRGTIGAEAAIRGTDATLVSGLGIVVGLNGTGGGEYPQAVLGNMEREVARNGIGKGGQAYGDLQGVTPLQFLRSPNIAIVTVQAVIPPGTPKGTNFDVYVSTLPGSSVTSLEGGTLWSTDLRLGPPSMVGGVRQRRLAEARGPIFINPFSEPAGGLSGESVGLTRTRGRVLAGGSVREPLKLQMVLDNESHSRARTIVNSINSRFPRGPGDEDPIARGRGSDGSGSNTYQSITITVPKSFSDDPAEFLQLLRYTRVDQSFPQEFARRYVEELKTNPAMATELSWCLQAVGKTAIPFLTPMYDYAELGPRMAALEAGAKLGDQRTVPHLLDLARNAPGSLRSEAIGLLSRMPANPNINVAMRDLVNAPELEIRVAAYEALAKHRDLAINRAPVGPDPRMPKFIVESIPAAEPMIYVTQQGEPRIVLFSPRSEGGIMFVKPTLVSMWSDRLIFNAPSATAKLRMRYINTGTGQATEREVPENAYDLIRYLAHRSTPEDPAPGLDLSYSEVVGALYSLSRQGGLNATFATEEDRLRAAILQAGRSATMADRPETTADEESGVTVFKPDLAGEGVAPAKEGSLTEENAATRKSKIVPLTRPVPKPASTD